MFTQEFDKYVCEGDTITTEKDGFEITAHVVRDQESHIDDDDCHNTDPEVTGVTPEQYQELLEARRAWFNDEWFYCGIVLTVSRNGVVLSDHAASLWGIEANYPDSDNSYLKEVANELFDEAVEEGKRILSKLLESV